MRNLERIIKKQERILKTSFTDSLSAYRLSLFKTELGETKFIKNLIYEDIPCYLSIGGVKPSDKTNVTSSVSNDYLIFTSKDIDLEDNDELIIKKYETTYKGKASKSYMYDTHNETSFRVEERV